MNKAATVNALVVDDEANIRIPKPFTPDQVELVTQRVATVRGMDLEALEPFRMPVQDHGLALQVELPDDLPDVWADTTRINHVFGNL